MSPSSEGLESEHKFSFYLCISLKSVNLGISPKAKISHQRDFCSTFAGKILRRFYVHSSRPKALWAQCEMGGVWGIATAHLIISGGVYAPIHQGVGSREGGVFQTSPPPRLSPVLVSVTKHSNNSLPAPHCVLLPRRFLLRGWKIKWDNERANALNVKRFAYERRWRLCLWWLRWMCLVSLQQSGIVFHCWKWSVTERVSVDKHYRQA